DSSNDESLRGDVSDYWLDDFKTDYQEYVQTNLSQKSLDNAKRVMKLFCNFVGKKKLGYIRSSDAEDFKQMRKNQKSRVSDATINMDIRTLKAAFQFAVDVGKLHENPFRAVKQIRCPRKQMATFSHTEFKHLTGHIKEPWLLDIVRFDVNTGLRRGEIVNLRWKDVDLANKRMLIQSSAEYQVKHGKFRQVPLNKAALGIVKRQSKETEWVFSDSNGYKFVDEFVSKKFKGYVRLCKLSEELHFHSLRATFATWAIAAGMSIYAVKAILGHASVKTSETYASYEMDALQKEVEKIVLVEEAEEFKAPLKLVGKKRS
ncbi:MAG: integrase, partial [Bacteroidota bacterium]